jgi:hypothetical protein
MFGYKVEAHERFAAVGSPNPQHVGQQGTGSVDVYRYDASKGTYSYYGTTQTLRAYGTSGTGGTSGTAGGGVAINYDGYGLSEKTVMKAKQSSYSLLITVDNGTSAFNALLKAKELNRNFLGCDINSEYVEYSMKRLK